MSGIVLLQGVGFANKGAELMLAAVTERMHNAAFDVAVDPRIGRFQDRGRYGLLQAFDVRSSGRFGPVIQILMRPGYRTSFGLVAPGDIDAVLDASGFFLGDQWIKFLPHYERKQQRFHKFKKANKPIVFLPQAFGPFENSRMASVTRELLSSADLVFARDESSLSSIQSLLPKHEGLRQAPDFTALLDGWEPRSLMLGPAPAAVIPNDQMLVHSKVDEATYVRFLADCIQSLRRHDLNPFILLHETVKDRPIADKVASVVGEIAVVEESDPRILKGIIGRCIVTVGSRFHGLVSALSQGVPSVGTGWSHKYLALFNDYRCAECLMEPGSGFNAAADMISTVLNEYENRKASLLSIAAETRTRAEAMWAEIEQLIGQSPSKRGL